MLDSLPIVQGVTELNMRLSDIQERLPVQLSLFDERKPVASLHEMATQWARRHRHVDFYRLVPTGDTQRPEVRVEKQKISSA